MDTIIAPPPVYRHGAQLAWLFAQAHEREMPPPDQVSFTNNEWEHHPAIGLNFKSLADLSAWALWADASIEDLIGNEDRFLGYGFDGEVNEVRVSCRYFTDEREVSA
ncbi:hypothetical protein [Nocardioides sp. BYT-33-1]|uniref:hypothetical protein n=1 Tax=Nocardioides sp. BYT-33-1 TaxID=3416952 RepID=UPI003F530862